MLVNNVLLIVLCACIKSSEENHFWGEESLENAPDALNSAGDQIQPMTNTESEETPTDFSDEDMSKILEELSNDPNIDWSSENDHDNELDDNNNNVAESEEEIINKISAEGIAEEILKESSDAKNIDSSFVVQPESEPQNTKGEQDFGDPLSDAGPNSMPEAQELDSSIIESNPPSLSQDESEYSILKPDPTLNHKIVDRSEVEFTAKVHSSEQENYDDDGIETSEEETINKFSSEDETEEDAQGNSGTKNINNFEAQPEPEAEPESMKDEDFANWLFGPNPVSEEDEKLDDAIIQPNPPSLIHNESKNSVLQLNHGIIEKSEVDGNPGNAQKTSGGINSSDEMNNSENLEPSKIPASYNNGEHLFDPSSNTMEEPQAALQENDQNPNTPTLRIESESDEPIMPSPKGDMKILEPRDRSLESSENHGEVDPICQKPRLDVCIVLDTSAFNSRSDFESAQHLIVDLVRNMSYSRNGIGLITFSDSVKTVFPVNNDLDYDETKQKILALEQSASASEHKVTLQALSSAVHLMQNSTSKYRGTAPKVLLAFLGTTINIDQLATLDKAVLSSNMTSIIVNVGQNELDQKYRLRLQDRLCSLPQSPLLNETFRDELGKEVRYFTFDISQHWISLQFKVKTGSIHGYDTERRVQFNIITGTIYDINTSNGRNNVVIRIEGLVGEKMNSYEMKVTARPKPAKLPTGIPLTIPSRNEFSEKIRTSTTTMYVSKSSEMAKSAKPSTETILAISPSLPIPNPGLKLTSSTEERKITCQERLDICIVWETSVSTPKDDFEKAKKFMATLVKEFPNRNQIGFITFSDRIQVVFPPSNNMTRPEMVVKILDIQQNVTSENLMAEAQIDAIQLMRKSSSKLQGAPKVIALFAEVSKISSMQNFYEIVARLSGITPIVVRVGQNSEISQFANRDGYFHLDSFGRLSSTFLQKFRSNLCDIPQSPGLRKIVKDELRKGEVRHFSYDIPQNGLNVSFVLAGNRGSILGSYSDSLPKVKNGNIFEVNDWMRTFSITFPQTYNNQKVEFRIEGNHEYVSTMYLVEATIGSYNFIPHTRVPSNYSSETSLYKSSTSKISSLPGVYFIGSTYLLIRAV